MKGFALGLSLSIAFILGCAAAPSAKRLVLVRMRDVVMLVAAIVLFGCGGAVISVSGVDVYERHWNGVVEALSRRAPAELGCPREEIRFGIVTKGARHVTQASAAGCGQYAVYVRTGYGWIQNSTRVEPTSSPAAATVPGPELALARHADQRIRGVRLTMRHRATEVVMQCAPESSPEVQARIESPTRPCSSVRIGDVTVTVGAELAHLTRAVVSEPLTAELCGEPWSLDAEEVAALQRFTASCEEATSASPPATSALTQTQLREVISSHAQLIRTCSQRPSEPLAVEASWEESGRVTISVEGISDTALPECIAAGTGELRVETNSAGRLLHAVQELR